MQIISYEDAHIVRRNRSYITGTFANKRAKFYINIGMAKWASIGFKDILRIYGKLGSHSI